MSISLPCLLEYTTDLRLSEISVSFASDLISHESEPTPEIYLRWAFLVSMTAVYLLVMFDMSVLSLLGLGMRGQSRRIQPLMSKTSMHSLPY